MVIDLLAAAMCEGDVEAAFYRYFSERFRQVALVAMRGGRPVLVRAGDRNDVRLAAPAIPLRASGVLTRVLAEGQVKYQPRLTDPERLARLIGLAE